MASSRVPQSLAATSTSVKTAPTSAPSRTSDRHQASVSAPSAAIFHSVAVASARVPRACVSPRASARSRRVPGSRQNQLAAGSGGAAGAATVLRSSSSPLGPTRRFSSSTKPSGLRAFAALPIASRRRCRSSAERFAPADLHFRVGASQKMHASASGGAASRGRALEALHDLCDERLEHYLWSFVLCRPVALQIEPYACEQLDLILAGQLYICACVASVDAL